MAGRRITGANQADCVLNANCPISKKVYDTTTVFIASSNSNLLPSEEDRYRDIVAPAAQPLSG